MSWEILISETAVETFNAIQDQIFQRLGNKAVEEFEKNTLKVLELIQHSPFMFKETVLDSNIRKGLIKKRSSIFYEVKSNTIVVLFFWDNRQEPAFF
ncbi:plasmid stabilization system protein ParE [Pedobacter africanus]|uniref:Plasmid stabilization system protein ParE n=1 Tax=Pedobacter africanus TaxID=151894 RepID=A0ACC6KZ15_9SPHI|nr:hypothetical protein [Pedobacter africanus]MDR6784615.1 plasmid stabilization system protein ParE [Pedobacter africanus]